MLITSLSLNFNVQGFKNIFLKFFSDFVIFIMIMIKINDKLFLVIKDITDLKKYVTECLDLISDDINPIFMSYFLFLNLLNL